MAPRPRRGVIGIDLGKTELRGVRLDGRGAVRRRIHRPSPIREGAPDPVGSLVELARELQEGRSLPVGVATFGVVDPTTGSVRSGGRVAHWSGVRLRVILRSRLGVPVRVENDAHAAARGEFLRGAARGWSSAVYLVVSTGVAAAFIDVHGVRLGGRGLAGQIARARLGPSGETLGRWLSGSGLSKRWSEARGSAGEAPALFRAAKGGDPTARRIVDGTVEELARTIAWVQILLDPDGFVLGGSVARAHPELLPRLRQRLAVLLAYYADVPPTVPRLLRERLGGWAGAIGAGEGALRGV